MSRASRRKALHPWRERERVARELEAFVILPNPTNSAEVLLDGLATFDVHAAREHGRSLVALTDEHDRFVEWTRSLGKGPENRDPMAFVPCSFCGCFGQPASHARCWGHRPRGGWPGDLARRWARMGNDRRAPMGRSLAKLGQAIIDALEGQPSECQACEGDGCELSWRRGTNEVEPSGPCPDCGGTGHNLRGVLPEPEVSPQLRRRIAETMTYANPGGHVHADWVSSLMIGQGPFDFTTRAVPRGEHRADLWSDDPSYVEPCFRGASLDRVITARGWNNWVPTGAGRVLTVDDDPSKLPRWRRGELRHAQQRREREVRRAALAHIPPGATDVRVEVTGPSSATFTATMPPNLDGAEMACEFTLHPEGLDRAGIDTFYRVRERLFGGDKDG